MSKKTVRTANSILLQSSMLLNKPMQVLPNTTLNQRLEIQQTALIPEGEYPTGQYIAIGNKGHRHDVGADGFPLIASNRHDPRHSGLFSLFPFILRLPSEDLTPVERINYRLRRMEVHDGTQYVAYYLKVLDLSQTSPTLELRTVSNGATTSLPYVPSLADLNPTPSAIQNEGVVTTTGDYIGCTAKASFKLNQFDIDELLNVANVIYGNTGYAVISEIGYCSGLDKTVTGDFDGVPLGYTEAIGVQVLNFISTFFPAEFLSDDFSLNMDIGGAEPLLSAT